MQFSRLLLPLMLCSTAWADLPQQDSSFIGAWVSQTEAKQDQESYELHALSVYRPDHSYNESVIVKSAQECTLIKTQGTWAYSAPTLTLTLKDSNMPQAIAAGSVSKKTLLSAADQQFRVQDEDQRQYSLQKVGQTADLADYQHAKTWCLQQELMAKDPKIITDQAPQPHQAPTQALSVRVPQGWLLKDSNEKTMLMSGTGSMVDIIHVSAKDAGQFHDKAPQMLASLSRGISSNHQPSLIKLSPPASATWQQMHQCYDTQNDPLLPKQTLCLVLAQKTDLDQVYRIASIVEADRQHQVWQLIDSIHASTSAP